MIAAEHGVAVFSAAWSGEGQWRERGICLPTLPPPKLAARKRRSSQRPFADWPRRASLQSDNFIAVARRPNSRVLGQGGPLAGASISQQPANSESIARATSDNQAAASRRGKGTGQPLATAQQQGQGQQQAQPKPGRKPSLGAARLERSAGRWRQPQYQDDQGTLPAGQARHGRPARRLSARKPGRPSTSRGTISRAAIAGKWADGARMTRAAAKGGSDYQDQQGGPYRPASQDLTGG